MNDTWGTIITFSSGGGGLSSVTSDGTLTGAGRTGSPLSVNISTVIEDAYDDADDRNSGNLSNDFEVFLNDGGDFYKVDLNQLRAWIAPRTLEQLQDASLRCSRTMTHTPTMTPTAR